MTLRPDEIGPGLLTELNDFVALIRPLDADEWATRSRCEGWSVADVAAHVIGSLTDAVSGRVEGLGTPEVTAREVKERKGRSPAELADEGDRTHKLVVDTLNLFDDAAWASPSPGGYDGTLAQGIEALWYDTWAHADDIRAALGRPTVGGAGLRAGLHHVAEVLEHQGWGPATLALDGFEPIGIGTGAGRQVTGDAVSFILAATGRADPTPLGLDETVNIYR